MLKGAARVGHQLNPLVCHHLTAAHAQLPERGAVAPHRAQPQIGHVALPNVEGAEAGAGLGRRLHPQVANALAASQIQVPVTKSMFIYLHLESRNLD